MNRILLALLLPALSCSLSAQDKPDLKQLLKTFRSEFVRIEPGTGKFPKQISAVNPETKKKVEIAFKEPFFINKYELPQNLWVAVTGANPSRWKGDRNSVEKMDFAEAVDFCNKITELLRKEKLITKNQFIRLPTELEWEYVASAGTKTKYYFGDDTTDLDDHAWHTGNAAGNDPPVGAKKKNPWGLYDIHGYLWEFTLDSWTGDSPLGQLDAKSWPPKKPAIVLKGGSWKDTADRLAIRFRQKADAKLRDDAVGLRCVLCEGK